MPKIPGYIAQRQMTTEVGRNLVNAASFKKTEVASEMLSSAGEALTKIGQHFEEIQNITQRTQAQTEAAKGMNDIYRKSVESTDIWGAGKTASEDIEKLKSDLSSKISNDQTRLQFEADFDRDAMSYNNRISNELRQRQALSAANSLIDFENSKISEYSSPDTTSYERQTILNSLNEKYQDYVKMGVIRPEVAVKAFNEAKVKMNNTYAENYVYNYPGIALEELSLGDKGMFKDIPADKKLDYEKTAKALIEKNNKENEKALNRLHNDTFNEAVKQKINGTLTPQMVKNWMDDGSLDPKSADVLLSSLVSVSKKEPSDEEKATAYLSLVNRQKELSDKGNKASLQDITKLRLDAVKMNADGLLSLDKLTKVLEITDKIFTSKLNNTENTFRKKYGKSTFAAINSWAEQNSPIAYKNETKARMYSDYMDRINNGETQTDALRNTIQGEKKPSQYKVGDLVTNPKTGEVAEIIGFNENGIPLLKRKVSGKPTNPAE